MAAETIQTPPEPVAGAMSAADLEKAAGLLARRGTLSIHERKNEPPEDRELLRRLKAELAKKVIYTVTVPKDPGSFPDFLKKHSIARKFNGVEKNVYRAMKSAEGFTLDDTLGQQIFYTFSRVTAVKAINVHRYKEDPDGDRHKHRYTAAPMVLAERMICTVPTFADAKSLNTLFQSFLHGKRDGRVNQVVSIEPNEESESWDVAVTDVTEHDLRAFSRIGEIMVRASWRARGVVAMPEKNRLEDLLNQGETFPDFVIEPLLATHAAYTATEPVATYTTPGAQPSGVASLKPLRKPSPAYLDTKFHQEGRDAFGPLIYWGRKDRTHVNPEQDPNPDGRLYLEEGIDVMRDQTPNLLRRAAPPQRSKKLSEKAADALEEALRDLENSLREEPSVAVAKLYERVTSIVSTVSGGVSQFLNPVTFGLGVAKRGPAVLRAAVDLAAEQKEWERQKASAKQAAATVIAETKKLAGERRVQEAAEKVQDTTLRKWFEKQRAVELAERTISKGMTQRAAIAAYGGTGRGTRRRSRS